ncbi:uncharacterized protein LOC122005046 isoform X2 [Zingiber officinale]|uniref:uncharacterized protein LOC122005046 isoform X2 n=1 Tax=Zingiber officinale TaxID=94328 RepID=UPI001C4D4406|nr:uncharacterized protein LOC122005046 isoform X2 [Zingiber officinale]
MPTRRARKPASFTPLFHPLDSPRTILLPRAIFLLSESNGIEGKQQFRGKFSPEGNPTMRCKGSPPPTSFPTAAKDFKDVGFSEGSRRYITKRFKRRPSRSQTDQRIQNMHFQVIAGTNINSTGRLIWQMHNQRLREHEIAAIFSRRKQIINHLILLDTSVCHDSRRFESSQFWQGQ